MEEKLTPLMEQYKKVKMQYNDCLLFYRLGDFYELFFQDAIIASNVLDIVLTRRAGGNKSSDTQSPEIPMCGIPFHAYESYVAKLLKHGFKIAICEQTETPQEAKEKRGNGAIVNREVIRIITPGTITEDAFLKSSDNNYLLSLYKSDKEDSKFVASWIDISSGDFFTKTFYNNDDINVFLTQINPSEIIVPDSFYNKDFFKQINLKFSEKITFRPDSGYVFNEFIQETISKIFNIKTIQSISNFSNDEILTIKNIIDYIELTNKTKYVSFRTIKHITNNENMFMDEFTFKSLEIINPLNDTTEKHSTLFSVINNTKSKFGYRLLKKWIINPITNINEINKRLDAVSFFIRNQSIINPIQTILKEAPDIQRILSRVIFDRANPRDLYAVLRYIQILPKIKSLLINQSDEPDFIKEINNNLNCLTFSDLEDLLFRALNPNNLPVLARDGGFIKENFNLTLDEYVDLVDDTQQVIASLQQKYSEISGVQSIKIKHNNLIGYFIEVSSKYANQLFENKFVFIHRQTIATAIRFTTTELSELETKIITAKNKRQALELEIFKDLCDNILKHADELNKTSDYVSMIDVFTSFAQTAITEDYTRPIIDNTKSFQIIGGRHPVVEKNIKSRTTANFIDNDCILQYEYDKKTDIENIIKTNNITGFNTSILSKIDDLKDNQIKTNSPLWLITGPNMAGKSTFLRQNAIIALMAHTGSFVPAKYAHIGVIDKLFSRVGASDNLATGQSTFMVEMLETSSILNKATDKSFVILDEIGRGTSTFDGMSIAYGVAKYLCEKTNCRGLFATHYHELTSIADKQKNITCHTMQVKEWKNDIVFLYKIISGVANKSYGISVAKLAGIPSEVINNAQKMLSKLENQSSNQSLDLFSYTENIEIQNNEKISNNTGFDNDLFSKYSEIIDEIKSLNPDEITAKEALNIIYDLSKKAKQ